MSEPKRTLPHSLDAEKTVLGAVLLAPRCFPEVRPLVEPEDFYHPVHEAIYAAACDLDARHRPIDPVTLGDQMRAAETAKILRAHGGEAYFAELTSAAVTAENVGYHARLVRDKATLRRLMEACQEVIAHGYGDYGDAADFLAETERQLSQILARRDVGTYQHIRQVLKRNIAVLERRYERKESITGVPTGFEEIDTLTGGLQPGHLVVCAARPKMGKSALVECAALSAAQARGIPALVVSLEMSDVELGERAISTDALVDRVFLRNGYLGRQDWARVTASVSRLTEVPIWIYSGGATFLQIRSLIRRWVMRELRGRLGLVMVDYLGLIRPERGKNRPFSREQEVAEWSRGFKELAGEISCPLVLLAQLNREVEKRSDKRPTMSDLRESGAIEADADLVLLLYRDEVYNRETKEPGIAEVILGANRHGPVGTVKLRFDGRFTRFENLRSPPPPDARLPDAPPPDARLPYVDGHDA